MKLGIIVALAEELKSLTNQTIETGSSINLKEDVLLFLSGTGPERAGEAASLLVEQGASALLSWGCAAGLISELKPGNLLLPEQIHSADGIVLPVDKDWHNRLQHILSGDIPILKGSLLEYVKIISDPDEKRLLNENSQAIAVDMESAAIAKVAQKNNLVFLAIKAIADTSHQRIPQSVLKSLDTHGQINKRVLIKHALLHPFDCIALAQLGRQFSLAKKTLLKIATIAPDDFLYVEPRA